MDFQLTKDQQGAMDMVAGLMDDDLPCSVGVATGFAGTGKTTMIKAIASMYGTPVVLAPTGKAALRVQEATGIEAMTLHRYLYRPQENSKSGEIDYTLKDASMLYRPENGLIICDESSMIGRELWEDLWNACQLKDMKVLLIGDPFQLAPIETLRDGEDSFAPLVMIETPHRAHLSEVTRQALDNPILRASMILRTSNRIDEALPLLNRVFTKNWDDKCLETYQSGGAIIVHKNDTRFKINATIRERLGFDEQLREKEPLLVLQNNYDIDRFNGEIIEFQGWKQNDASPLVVTDRWKNISKMLTYGVAQVDNNEVLLVPEQVHGQTQGMSNSVIVGAGRGYYAKFYSPDNWEPYANKIWQGPPHVHANFGYSLTCHKSQGSEWKNVLVLIEKSTRISSIEGRRWLYTAITRAKENCSFAMEV